MANRLVASCDSRTFKPAITEDGKVLAGGMKIAVLRGSCLVFEDDLYARVNRRDTPDVPVDLAELVDAVIERLRGLDK